MNSFFLENMHHLLKNNLEQVDVYNNLGRERIAIDLQRYLDSLLKNTNYNRSEVDKLEDWRSPLNAVHPFQKQIADICSALNVQNVLDAGAGAGAVAKIVRSQCDAKLTCVEKSPIHFTQMYENFNTRTDVVGPNIKVDAILFNRSLHDLTNFEDGEFDMVYTCTVAMHIPFIPAIGVLCELARVTSKYILHVENVRACTAIGDMREHFENTRSIDYVKLYESLGFKTVTYQIDDYPEYPGHKYVLYLACKE